MRTKILILIIWGALLVCTSRSQGLGDGKRINLSTDLGLAGGQFAQLFIPDYYSLPVDGKIMLVIHFHSASWAAEDEVYRSGVNAVLFNIHLGALSSPYQNYFANTNRFPAILDLVKSTLSSKANIPNPEIDKLVLTSFSAGYAGVREILAVADYYKRIDALILADGLHSSSASSLMQSQLQNFVKFAGDARDRQKIMYLTHSSIPTSGYRSTTETANYLLYKIGAQREPVNLRDEIGLCTSVCDTGYFHLKGYTGETAEDHLKHLYNMHQMLRPAVELIEQMTAGVKSAPTRTGSHLRSQNYPNPFNASTRIWYELPAATSVALRIFNSAGQLVQTLVQGEESAGGHEAAWMAAGFASGVYFYELRAGADVVRGRCLLVR